jgi:phosphate/sulfate permease
LHRFFIIFKGTPALQLDQTPLWLGLVVSAAAGIFFGVLACLFIVPIIKKRIQYMWRAKTEASSASQQPVEDGTRQGVVAIEPLDDTDLAQARTFGEKFRRGLNRDVVAYELESVAIQRLHGTVEVFCDKTGEQILSIRCELKLSPIYAEFIFSYLQVLTAVFDSFAHGSNDVANSIAPLATIMAVYVNGVVEAKSAVPVWILAFGGAGIVAGLLIWGYRIIG